MRVRARAEVIEAGIVGPEVRDARIILPLSSAVDVDLSHDEALQLRRLLDRAIKIAERQTNDAWRERMAQLRREEG